MPQPRWIQTTSVTYATACGNAGSLTHWGRPGIEPTSSWRLCQALTHWATMGNPSPLSSYSPFFVANTAGMPDILPHINWFDSLLEMQAHWGKGPWLFMAVKFQNCESYLIYTIGYQLIFVLIIFQGLDRTFLFSMPLTRLLSYSFFWQAHLKYALSIGQM